MKYLGRLPVSMFSDRQIMAREYRRWDDARRQFSRPGKDRDTVDQWKRKIEKGKLEPLILGVSDRHPDVYIGDGHHRAIALMELGVKEFPFRWYWIKWIGVSMEREPFPYHLLGR
jgi:ParB-like chromosome segregation protein Spo0J